MQSRKLAIFSSLVHKKKNEEWLMVCADWRMAHRRNHLHGFHSIDRKRERGPERTNLPVSKRWGLPYVHFRANNLAQIPRCIKYVQYYVVLAS